MGVCTLRSLPSANCSLFVLLLYLLLWCMCVFQVSLVFQHIMQEKDLLLAEPQKKQVTMDQEFIMSLLHLVFELLFDNDIEVRYSAMGFFRDLMLKRDLRPLFTVTHSSGPVTAGTPPASAAFQVDVYTGNFDRLVVDPENKTSTSRDKVNPAVFEGFQAQLVRLLPTSRA